MYNYFRRQKTRFGRSGHLRVFRLLEINSEFSGPFVGFKGILIMWDSMKYNGSDIFYALIQQ